MSDRSILITGISGFVGGHYSSFIINNRKDWTIHGISRSKPAWDFLPGCDTILDSINFHQGNLLDENNTLDVIKEINPDYILHLAAFSSVAESWQQPRSAFLNNTNAFLNVVESVRTAADECRILSVGSSEEYGIVTQSHLPLKEDCYNRPANPYAVARVAQEDLANIYTRGYNLDICCTRSFNHIGPGQQTKFVISSIAKQFAEIMIRKAAPVIRIGNGNIVRDFIDIDDVIRAYDAIFEKGKKGEIYNVCSGAGSTIAHIVQIYSQMLDLPVHIEQQNDLIRPIDNPVLFGDYAKLARDTGWKPQVTLEESLDKIYKYWCKKLIEK
ncbi:MAG: GDP-mannose 4,6-dehydratase [Methanoregula sp.]|nr:GDP-mannose 4,6-dehydratase [Methanoregula sp.]